MSETTEYTISVPKDLWEKFKKKTTKDKTLNQQIIELIKQFCEDK